MLAQITALIRVVDSYPSSLHIALLVGLGIAWTVCGQIRDYWSDLNVPSEVASLLTWLFGFVLFLFIIVVILEAIWLRKYSHLVWIAIAATVLTST